jgi:hypothetical protein
MGGRLRVVLSLEPNFRISNWIKMKGVGGRD